MPQVQVLDGPNVLSVNLVLDFSHEYPGAATRFPLENGGFVGDHVRNDPIEITLKAFVTNTPLGDPAPKAVVDTYAQLMAIRDARRPVVLISDLRRFPSMVLESLSIPRNAEDGYLPREPKTGGHMTFTAKFVEFRIVSTQTARVAGARTPRPGKVADQARHRVDRGRQSLQPVSSQSLATQYRQALANVQQNVQSALSPGSNERATYSSGKGPIQPPTILTPPGG